MSNPFRGFLAILFKEFTVIFRDRTTLFFMFFPPLMQIIAFGYALDNDVKHMPMVVLNEDRSTESRQLIDAFVNTQTFRVVKEVSSVAEISASIRRGDAYVGLDIPPDFTRELRAGRTGRVQVLIDGSSSTTALQALNTAVALALRQSLTTLLQDTGRTDLPIEVRPQVLYNPAMKSPNFFVPGVIGLALQIATIFATAMSMVRERERGTLEQLLVSPVSRWGLMLGKVVPYLCISLAMAVGLFLILRWVFFIPIQGSLMALALATFLYVFALLSLGLLISTKAENIMQSFQMTMAILLPSVFFSGFIFPRETMPGIFYAISTLLPATYYIELLRAIILRGATIGEFWFHMAILAGMGAFLFSWVRVAVSKEPGLSLSKKPSTVDNFVFWTYICTGMSTISYTEAREQLAHTMDRVCDDREPVIITRQKQRSVVMLSLEDYESLAETAYLLKSRKNAKRLLAAMQQLEAGKGKRRKVNLDA